MLQPQTIAHAIAPAFAPALPLPHHIMAPNVPPKLWFPQPGEDIIWTNVGALKTARGMLGAARLGQQVYTFGGVLPGSAWAMDTVEEFNVTTYQSTSLPGLQLPSPMEHAAASFSSTGSVYVCGIYPRRPGPPGREALCYECIPPAGPWNKKADIPQIQIAAAGAMVGDKIYVIGGLDPVDEANPSWTVVKNVHCFNPGDGSWSEVAPLNTARFCAAAATAGGKIYVFGGIGEAHTPIANVEVYDPATNQWIPQQDMPTNRYNHVAVTGSNGRIYVIGGILLCSFVDMVEELDPQEGEWREMMPMPTGRQGAAAVATDDGRIFVLGGYIRVGDTVEATDVIEEAVLPMGE